MSAPARTQTWRHYYVDCRILDRDGGDLERTRAGTNCPNCRWRLTEPERLKRAAARREKARVGNRRLPPRPPHEATKGICSLCGTPVSGRRRSWCSDDCVTIWWVASNGPAALAHLTDLHGWVCWVCDLREEPGYYFVSTWAHSTYQPTLGPPPPQVVTLEVDHVRPIWTLSDEDRLELRWWLPFNLQALCRPCHRAKTAHEAAERARIKRGEPGAFRPWALEKGTR